MRQQIEVATRCPGCAVEIKGPGFVTVTNYQPAGPPGTKRLTQVAWRPDEDRSRVILTHECDGGIPTRWEGEAL